MMINWTRLTELRAEIGDDDLQEVIGLFLEETDAVIARLSQRRDPTRLESDLHFLKGSALNLGFSALADLCQAGERKAAQGAAVTVAILPIIALYRDSKAAFLAGGQQSSVA